jgi:type IV pilus assembly protein PilA
MTQTSNTGILRTKAFSQLLWPHEGREEWFSLGENHERLVPFGLHQLRNRTNRQSGFTLMELLIVMSIMIILMLIAIPNFISMKAQADETSAIQSLRAIYQAQIQYQTDFPANGFACALPALGGNASAGPPSAQAAQVLQGDLATGQKSGYTFNIVNCNKVNVNNQDMYTSYEATAVPQSIGKSGHRGFCIDSAGEIKSDPAGGTNCSQPIQ